LSTFFLVHGAWHGAWCWYRVVPLLERRGHRVVTPELPAHGLDATPAAAVSLADYAGHVAEALRAAPEPVVLVGHSLGGMVISAAAELVPERVRCLAYVAAFLPGDGDSLVRLADGDTENQLTPHCTADPAAGLLHLAPAGLRPAFYADCADEDVALAARLARPEPLRPLAEPVHLTPGRWGAIPRAYVECAADRALPPARQRLMQAARPCQRVLRLASGHSPFFSQPGALVEYVASLAAPA